MSNQVENKIEESHLETSNENCNKFSPSSSENTIDDLVKSDSKIPLKTPVIDGDVQVKFSINDSPSEKKNKCEAENAFSTFCGLSKEELLKYANDPFWVKMRLILFIFFWMVWLAMFIGAIAIIVMAPKCEPPKQPEWYEQGPLYEVDASTLVYNQENTSFWQYLKTKLEYLSDLQVKGIIFSPIFKTDGENEENVVDFKSLDDKFGTMEEFKEFMHETKLKGIKVILTFVPNHSSNKHAWFNKSIARESPYDDFYIWAPASGSNPDGSKIPPNNWLSVYDGPAWEWVENRQEFYLHQFAVNQPDLNYHNPNVLKEINDTLSFWIDLGVSGFNLDKVQYLLEDVGLKDEVPGDKPGVVHTQYDFYSHKKTRNIPADADIISSWRQIIKEKTNGNGILIVTGDVPIPTDSDNSTVLVDVTRSDKLLKDLKKDFSANDLYNHLQKIMSGSERWPSVQLGDRFMKRVADLYGEDSIDGLNMVTMLLPATPITYFGEEFGLSEDLVSDWGNKTSEVSQEHETEESHYDIYKALVEARNTQTILYGNLSLQVLNDSVLLLTRIKLGNPGYMVAYNPSSENVTVDLSNLEFVPNDLLLYAKSVNFVVDGDDPSKDKFKSKNVFLGPKSAAVFTFAPKTDD